MRFSHLLPENGLLRCFKLHLAAALISFIGVNPVHAGELAALLRVDKYFADEFTAENTSWIKGNWSFPESDTQFAPGQISFANGQLKLALARQANAGKHYTGGHYQTQRSDFGYGVYEVVMQPAAGPGVISSFFTFWDGELSRAWNEIDIEFLRGNREVQFNYINAAGNVETHATPITLPFDATSGLYPYRFEYTPDFIRFYAGNERLAEIRDARLPQIAAMPDGKGMKIMMNVWIPIASLQSWAGNPATAALPGFALYDAVRYYPSFGDVALGSRKTEILTVTNTASETLTLSALLGGTNAYSIADNTCDALAPSAQCRITVAFAPPATGLATATLVLSDPRRGNIEIPLWGHGAAQSGGQNNNAADIRFTRAVTNSWNTGYCQNTTITNQGTAAAQWEISFETAGTLGDHWEGVFSQSGNIVTVRGFDWNATLQPGSAVTVGNCILGEAAPITKPATCAVYQPTPQPSLRVPCVMANGKAYRADMAFVPASNLRLALIPNSLQAANVAPDAGCAAFPIGGRNALRLNCVTAGSSEFWAELALLPDPASSVFELEYYGVR